MLELDAVKTMNWAMRVVPGEPGQLHWRAHRGLLIFLGALTGLDLIWMALSDLDLAFWPAVGRFSIVGSLLLIAGYYGVSGRSLRICATLLAVAELLLITLAGTMLSYLAIRAGNPMADSLMASIDTALGFDWPAYETFVIKHYWAGLITGMLYPTSIFQVLIVVLVLGFTGRLAVLRDFTAGLTIAAVATVVIGAMLPGMGAHHYYNVPDFGIASFVPSIVGAHDGSMRILDLTNAEGLVFFPSYHTAISIAVVVACWSVRYLRYPALIANTLLIAGVPVWGSHYFIDVIGGAVMISVVLVTWRWATSRSKAISPADAES